MKNKKKSLLDKLIEKKFGRDPLAEAPTKDKPVPIDKKRIKDGPPKERPVVKPVIK